MKTLALAFYTIAYVLALTLAAGTAHAQSIPATQSSVVRARLVAAVDTGLPATQCRIGVPNAVITINDSTRVIGCGLLPGFDAALVQFVGETLARLNARRPSVQALQDADTLAAYLESLIASRRIAPEITFPAETVVATRR